jgi:hypothetical protein
MTTHVKPIGRHEARALWAADAAFFKRYGIHFDGASSYMPEEFKHNFDMACDAQPALSSVTSAGIPAFFTTMVDPEPIRVVFAPNKGAEILGEAKKGTWIDDTLMMLFVEHVGEVTGYGDYDESGGANANVNYPQRQQFIYQTMKQYGEREIERAGQGKLSWVSELDMAAATVMAKFSNLTYHFGVLGLQNYGLINDPNLSSPLTPATKTGGGTQWFTSAGLSNCTANEVYNDIITLWSQMVKQTLGTIEKTAPMKLVMSPSSAVALTFTNSFSVNVEDLLKKNFPSIKIEEDPLYGSNGSSSLNGQGIGGGYTPGIAAGNYVQLIASTIEGKKNGFCAFGEKMRTHPIIRLTSSFKQKVSGGTWGAVIRYPITFASLLGV